MLWESLSGRGIVSYSRSCRYQFCFSFWPWVLLFCLVILCCFLLFWCPRSCYRILAGEILLQPAWRCCGFVCFVMARAGEHSLLHDVQDCTWLVAAVCINNFSFFFSTWILVTWLEAVGVWKKREKWTFAFWKLRQEICVLKLRQEDLLFKAPSRRFAF